MKLKRFSILDCYLYSRVKSLPCLVKRIGIFSFLPLALPLSVQAGCLHSLEKSNNIEVLDGADLGQTVSASRWNGDQTRPSFSVCTPLKDENKLVYGFNCIGLKFVQQGPIYYIQHNEDLYPLSPVQDSASRQSFERTMPSDMYDKCTLTGNGTIIHEQSFYSLHESENLSSRYIIFKESSRAEFRTRPKPIF